MDRKDGRPEDFTFEQKEQIIFQTFNKYQLICPIYGIIKCPSCYCKMALGFEFRKDGKPYYSLENYQQIHLKLGFRLIPNNYQDISRIHIDHLTPCYYGGLASLDNGLMICESCNLIFREFLTKEDKLFLLNTDAGLMDCIDVEYYSKKGQFIVVQNDKVIFKDKDIIRSILYQREKNKNDLEITPMYD